MREPRARASEAYDRIVRILLEGRLAEVEAALDDEAVVLPASERAELRASVEFHSGKLRTPRAPSAWTRLAWRVWADMPGGRAVVFATLRLAARCVSLLGARERTYEALRLRLAPEIVHFRYTDFIQGLVWSAILHAFAPSRSRSQRAYYLGLVGMFECLSGRFDHGIRSLDAGHAALVVENDALNGTRLEDADVYDKLMSIATVRALYLSYAGNHDEAYREFDRVLQRTRTTCRYVLIEIFLYSVRMYADVESLNAESLAEGASALKRLLGTYFRGKFGLRAAIYASVVATLQGNSELARQQLALSDELYNESLASVELARYHFLRALVHLETSEIHAAKLHARHAAAFASNVRGSRFHEADIALLELELRLRAALREGELGRAALEHPESERAFRRVARLVRGSALFDARLRALRLFERFLRGDFHARDESTMADVKAFAWRVSRRLEHVLREIETRPGEKRALALAETDAKRRRELNLLDRFGRLAREGASDDEAARLLSFLVAAESCEVRKETGVSDAGEPVVVRPSDDWLEVEITAGSQRRTFVLRRPLVELTLDLRAAELVRLAAEMVRSALERERLFELQRQAAIARTTQMLAHDVRRPFGTLQAVMKAIASARTPVEVQTIVEGYLPEVQKASATVAALIDDVVELGIDRKPRREATLPELVFGDCVTEALRMPEARDITVEYALEHSRPWFVEAVRVRRVLANLLSNAAQALRGTGRIWIRSRDVGDFIETVVGNDGPPIAEEDLPRLFEVFFTKEKAKGTGLGLAIAYHVVTSHGGRIEAKNRAGGGVEFLFTLPAAAEGTIDAVAAEQLRAALPSSSRAVSLVPPSERGAGINVAKGGLSKEERAAIARLAYIGRPLDVVMVDGEPSYLASLEAIFAEVAPPGALRVLSVTGAPAALAVIRERPPDLAIIDASLAGGDGYKVARVVREAGRGAYVCLQSRAASADHVRLATEAGADIFLLKPLTAPHALRLLAACVERRHSTIRQPAQATVALVDDSRAHLADWRGALQADAALRPFGSPSAFWTAIEREPDLLARLDLVITDYQFLGSHENGVGFARTIKSRRVDLPVCLSTSSACVDEDLDDAIDAVLDKSAVSWAVLTERLRLHRDRPARAWDRETIGASEERQESHHGSNA